MTVQEWSIHDIDPAVRRSVLPPNLLLQVRRGSEGQCCSAEHTGTRFLCTRLPGHTGQHAAGAGMHILAVWP